MEIVQEGNEEKKGLSPEEIAEIREKVLKSQEEFDMRNQVNGLTTHILTALINGVTSQAGCYNTPLYFDAHFADAREMAEKVYANNKAYVTEGVTELEKGE